MVAAYSRVRAYFAKEHFWVGTYSRGRGKGLFEGGGLFEDLPLRLMMDIFQSVLKSIELKSATLFRSYEGYSQESSFKKLSKCA